MSSTEASDFEARLRRALVPVDPPADLAQRLESTLVELTSLAADELEGWELGAMRDPRNWVRPVAATVFGTGAGVALVVLRVRSQRHRRRAQSTGARDLARRTIRDVANEAGKLVPGRRGG